MIRRIMAEKGISAEKLASDAAVSLSTVNRAMGGKRINRNNLERICSVLNIKVSDVLQEPERKSES